MKWCLLLLALASQLYGCGAGLRNVATSPDLLADQPSLWQLQIGRGDSSIFTGLLVLKPEGEDLHAVLLDSMGIKLLEEKIDQGGNVEVIYAIPMVKDKRLPTFLGGGLHRLFFNNGGFAGRTCRSDGWATVCLGEKAAGHLVKLRRVGPFVLWSADYLINNYDSAAVMTDARLNSGWLVPYLHLKKNDVENGASGDPDNNQR